VNLEIVAATLTAGLLKKGSSTVECVEAYYATLDLLATLDRERRVKTSAAATLASGR
jgi:hypothetical protein